MTATDGLRAMLDERGVEWSSIGGDTAWEDSRGWTATAEADSVDGSMVYVTALMTPEQAIEATLGPREQPPYDELIEALRRDWDIEASWDGLRRFWYVGLTDEGVRKRDEREATLGRGECRAVKVNRLADDNDPYDICACSECGAYLDPMWHYCGICGRKVVDEWRDRGIAGDAGRTRGGAGAWYPKWLPRFGRADIRPRGRVLLMKNAVMAAVIAFLVVFLLWFVLFMPAPDYMPEYGSDPRDIPHQMMD